MTIRDILVHVDADDPAGAGTKRVNYALSLARQFDAHLTGLVLALEASIPPTIMGEVPVTLLDMQRQRAAEEAAAGAARFKAAAERAGGRTETRTVQCSEGEAGDLLVSSARVSDLLILGQNAPDDFFPLRTMFIKTALFQSGRPVLIVPYIGPEEASLDQVTIAWNGGREAARAVHDALPLLRRATRVNVVVAGEVPVAHGDVEAGSDLALNLARHGLKVNLDRIDGSANDVGETLLSYLADTDSNLLVMGGYGHSRLRQYVLGGVTRTILDSMTVPVLMSH